MRSVLRAFLLATVCGFVACGTSRGTNSNSATAGAGATSMPNSGGSTGLIGAAGSGGNTASGGTNTLGGSATGGTTHNGGSPSSGGMMASGGTPPAGGAPAAGNTSGGGGSTAVGSAGSAGTPASGGSAGSGGQAAGDGYGWSGVDHAPTAITECSCNIAADGSDTQRCVKVVNRCTQAIRFHAAGTDTPANTFAGQVDLAPGACQSYVLTNFTSGRLWAETNCNGGQCDPGPYTLAEFSLSGYQNLDFYDLSLVDGFNVPMSIRPVDGTFTPGGGKYKCGTPICLYDLVNNCPADLLKNNAQAQPAVCQSACSAFHEDQYCCAGAFSGGPQQCPPSMYSQDFKMACPDAYSYAFDDQASTYTCAGNDLAPDYDIIFCQ